MTIWICNEYLDIIPLFEGHIFSTLWPSVSIFEYLYYTGFIYSYDIQDVKLLTYPGLT